MASSQSIIGTGYTRTIFKRSTDWGSTLLGTPHRDLPFDFFFVYLGFYVAFNTVQVISRRVVGRAEETST